MEGANTLKVSVPEAGVVFVKVIANGLGAHVTPAGSPAAGHVTLAVCVPVDPAPGVTVIVEVPLIPAVTVTALPLMLNVPEPAVIVSVGGVGFVSGPPPGCGLNVSTVTVCAVVRLAAGTCMVKVLELQVLGVAAIATPLNSTCVGLVPHRKLLPFTVSNSELAPDDPVVGEMEVIPGIGLRTVNGTAFVGFGCAGSVTVICARTPFCS